jgi:biotin carboxyl carrier protein
MLKDRDVEIVKTSNSELKTTSRDTDRYTTNTNQSVIFQQSKIWSRAIGWGIMGLIVAVITWASLAHIDEAIPADGKLEPLDDAKKIQSPMAGVVKQIYIKNGDRVKAGDLLLRLESTIPESQLTYLAATKASLAAENSFYRAQMTNERGKGKAKNAVLGFPRLVSPFLTGNPSKGETQVERFFKTGEGGKGKLRHEVADV